MATAPVNQIYAILKAWRNAIFPPVGRGFDEYFTSRTFHINQFACVFAFALVTLFGLLDLLDNSGGVNQTRFRLMVTGPTCLIFLGLSFTPLARRNSQTFIMAFGCVLILLVYKMMQMVDGSFPVTTGAPTTTFLILMSLMTVLPLRTANAVALGFLAFLAHAIYTLHASVLVPRALLAGYWICVFSTWAGSAVAAYFRERAMRKSFLELDSATSKIAELKERVVALAVERHQLPSPHIGRRKIARPQVSDDRSEFGMG